MSERRIALLRCQACEAPRLERTSLDFIANDGAIGEIAGVACRACGFIAADRDAAPVVTGHIDLGGMSALEWMLTGLRAAGCDPKPRP
jgi:hypothetical protein